MRKKFKKLLTSVLALIMFLFPAPRAFAQIEVVEFSDGPHEVVKLVRFTRADLQDVLQYYQSNVLKAIEYNQLVEDFDNMCRAGCAACCAGCSCAAYCASCDRCGASCCDRRPGQTLSPSLMWGLALFGTGSVGCYGLVRMLGDLAEVTDSTAGLVIICLIAAAIVAIYFMCVCHECCFGKCAECCGECDCGECDRGGPNRVSSNMLAGGLKIRDQMTELLSSISGDEAQPLLQAERQDIPEDFLLLIPSSRTSPIRLKFVTDRDTDMSQDLKDNRFILFIIRSVIELRDKGVRVSDKYRLTRVGNSFHMARDVSVMPEIDSVEVVVDGVNAV